MAKNQANQAIQPEEAAEPEGPVAGLDFSVVSEAGQARCVDGVVVDLGPRWNGLQPRLVSHKSSEMEIFISRTKTKEISRYNLEHPTTKGKPQALFNFAQLPDQHRNRAHITIVVESLRGGGKGVIRWQGEDGPGALDLAGASTEETRTAFRQALESVDHGVNPWLLKDLYDAGNLLDDVTDESILDAKKKGLACGLQPLLAANVSGATKLVRALEGWEAAARKIEEDLDKAEPKTPTSKSRRRRTA